MEQGGSDGEPDRFTAGRPEVDSAIFATDATRANRHQAMVGREEPLIPIMPGDAPPGTASGTASGTARARAAHGADPTLANDGPSLDQDRPARAAAGAADAIAAVRTHDSIDAEFPVGNQVDRTAAIATPGSIGASAAAARAGLEWEGGRSGRLTPPRMEDPGTD